MLREPLNSSKNIVAKQALIDIIKSPQNLILEPEAAKPYGKDWTSYYDIKTSGVVFPQSLAEIQSIVRWAREFRFPLVVSGGRTGLSGGACATQNELIISFAKMRRIHEETFDSAERSVTVDAGVTTQEVQEFASQKGLFYPIDFAARGSAHIGGNIATNAGGIRVLKYGLTRNWVQAIKVVTGTGEILHLNKDLVKNATGFDLRHLLIGSEGTLAVVVEASLRMTTPPPPLVTCLLAIDHLDLIMPTFSELQKQLSLNAFEMFSQVARVFVERHRGVEFPLQNQGSYYLVVDVEETQNSTREVLENCLGALLEKKYIKDARLATSHSEAQEFWIWRENITEALASYSPYKNDLSVRISKVPEFLRSLQKSFSSAYPHWQVVEFGHVGDGNLHISIVKPENLDKKEFLSQIKSVEKIVYRTIQDLEGSISAEHGVGLSKREFLNYTRSAIELDLFRQIKKSFDPDNILNPGKLINI